MYGPITANSYDSQIKTSHHGVDFLSQDSIKTYGRVDIFLFFNKKLND